MGHRDVAKLLATKQAIASMAQLAEWEVRVVQWLTA